MKKTLLFLALVLMGLSMVAQTSYTLVTSESELSAGDKVVLVGVNMDEETAWVMSYQKSNNRHAIQVTDIEEESIVLVPASSASSQTEAFELTVGGQAGAWTFFDELNNGYLYAPGGGNYLRTQGTLDDKGKWSISVGEDGFVLTSNGGVEQNIMRYNVSSTLFGCYKASSTVNGEIFIFKAGGSVISPEPSNYPTNFAGTLDITKATLTWTASTGEQLPRGYVVLGSTEGIVPPVDGTPVDNDTDASDGYVALNTMGTTVAFDQLTPNSTWQFAIFPFTNSGENINYKTDGVYPTVNIETQNVTCIFASNFAEGLDPFTAVNIEGTQEWMTSVYDGIPFAKMSGYSSTKAYYDNEDWLITPELLNSNTYASLTIAFMNAYKFDGDALQCYYSTNYDGMSDPTESTFTWVNITNNFEWSAGDYAWANTNYTLNTSGMAALYVAFKYTSTTTAASTWEIADFKVYEGYNAVNEYEAASAFNLYPNPANDVVRINAEGNAVVDIMDMAGRMVMSVNVAEGENTINVSDLATGVYFVRMNSTVVKFVKR